MIFKSSFYIRAYVSLCIVLNIIHTILLGTVYLQQTTPLLIISGVSVFSAASGIFMFTAMYPFYTKALQVCI